MLYKQFDWETFRKHHGFVWMAPSHFIPVVINGFTFHYWMSCPSLKTIKPWPTHTCHLTSWVSGSEVETTKPQLKWMWSFLPGSGCKKIVSSFTSLMGKNKAIIKLPFAPQIRIILLKVMPHKIHLWFNSKSSCVTKEKKMEWRSFNILCLSSTTQSAQQHWLDIIIICQFGRGTCVMRDNHHVCCCRIVP